MAAMELTSPFLVKAVLGTEMELQISPDGAGFSWELKASYGGSEREGWTMGKRGKREEYWERKFMAVKTAFTCGNSNRTDGRQCRGAHMVMTARQQLVDHTTGARVAIIAATITTAGEWYEEGTGAQSGGITQQCRNEDEAILAAHPCSIAHDKNQSKTEAKRGRGLCTSCNGLKHMTTRPRSCSLGVDTSTRKEQNRTEVGDMDSTYIRP